MIKSTSTIGCDAPGCDVERIVLLRHDDPRARARLETIPPEGWLLIVRHDAEGARDLLLCPEHAEAIRRKVVEMIS